MFLRIIKLKTITIISTLISSPCFAQTIIDDPHGMPDRAKDVENLIMRLQNIVFALAGGVAVVMIIWAAAILLTAGGNEERVSKGKKTLAYAVGGIILVIASYVIVRIFIYILGGRVS